MGQSFDEARGHRAARRLGIAAAVVFLLIPVSGCGVKQIRDQVTVEAGQEIRLSAEDFFDASGKNMEKIAFELSQVDSNRVGSYQATAAFGKERYPITVFVADRTPPMVELSRRVVFTDDLKSYDPMELVEGVYDASEYTVKLIRYAREADLGEITDLGWESLKALRSETLSQEELEQLGTEVIPKEEGIYRGVLAAADVYDNVWLEQVWIVFQKQEAEKPEVHMADREQKEESTQHVTITSPAGEGNVPTGREEGLSPGNGDVRPSITASALEGSPETEPDYYDTHLEEGQLAAVNAGYYQVVPDPRYGGYIVMVHGGEGSYGTKLIREYLASISCEATGGSGDWISMDGDQYAVYVTAEEIRPLGEGEESDWGELIWK